MRTSEQIDQISAALVVALAEVENAKKDSANPMLRNRYASLEAVLEVGKSALSANGCAVIQEDAPGLSSPFLEFVPSEDGKTRVCRGLVYTGMTTRILHVSGQWFEGFSECAYDPFQKGINAAQAKGSASTYLRRYTLAAMLGIGQDDDDGCLGQTQARSQSAPRPERSAPPVSQQGQGEELNDAPPYTPVSELDPFKDDSSPACSGCSAAISTGCQIYSEKKYGKALCPACQKGAGK